MASQVSPPPSLTSSLNPHAALFIPSSAPHAFTIDDVDDDDTFDPEVIMPEWDVEDFSPEWWTLVQTSPEFCDFWLHGYEANLAAGADAEDLLFVMQCENVIDDDATVDDNATVDQYTEHSDHAN